MTAVERPRVVLSAGGKFHAYHMARAAQNAGLLERFVTTVFDRSETGIDRERVAEVPWGAALALLVRSLPPRSASLFLSYRLGDALFDRLAGRRVGATDIFHFFSGHGLYSARKAARLGARTIVERSSAHPVEQYELLSEEYRRWGLRYARTSRLTIPRQVQEFEQADYVMAPSEFVRRSLAAGGVPAEKLLLLPLGFAPEHYQPAEKTDAVFRVVFAGTISLQKGVQYLIEAFRAAAIPNSELLLVGGTFPDAGAFLPQNAGSYRHVAYLRPADLAQCFQQASVLVLPSIQDGWGMVVFEAAACGLPVIITGNVGATVRDGEDGFVVPIRSAAAIAEKLAYLHVHEAERLRMGRSARDYVSRFTWERYRRELVGQYRALAA